MRARMLALISGLLSLPLLPALPGISWLILLSLLALGCLWCGWRLPACFAIGFVWACLCGYWAVEERLLPTLDGQTVWLEGRVAGLPQVGERSVRFELVDAASRRAQLPTRIRLSWFGGPPVREGERWRLAVTLRSPHGLVNPHALDPEAGLLARRIGATGSVKAGERLQEVSGGWRDRLRQRLLETPAAGREAVLVALVLVLGDGGGLAHQVWEVLRDTGTVHLLVISGQHIGLCAGLLYGLVALAARWGLWPRRWPWLPCACLLAFVGALGYGWLAGFGVPVQRALGMLGMVLLWRWRLRHLGVGWPLLLALAAVLLVDPLASLLPGFWLSFGAVAVLTLTFAGRLGAWSWWRAWGRAQWTVAVGLLPILMMLGLPVSVTAPLANLLAVPWIGLAVLPLALLGTLLLPLPGLGEGLLWLAGHSVDGLLRLLEVAAAWRPAWQPAALPLGVWLLVCAGALLVLLPSGVPLRLLGVPLLALALWAPRERMDQGRVKVWQLDVGQGLAFVLQTRDHSLLYDAGPAMGGQDLGARVVLPTLRRLGIDTLDLMLISHADADHAGGAAAVRRGVPVKRLISGDPLAHPGHWGAEPCRKGHGWEWDGVRFSLWQWGQGGDDNQESCVLLVEASGERLLLTGDIDTRAERAWVRDHPGITVDWLQAPHHGSKTSSSALLLDALAPKGVWVSRGRANSFGHPHPDVMARYRSRGLLVFDSVEQGAVSLELGALAQPTGLREDRRFWRTSRHDGLGQAGPP